MAGSDQWEKLLDLYIHDYLTKNKSKETAEIFKSEAHVPSKPVAIDEPEGFLKEWWSIFYDTYVSQMHNNHEAKEEVPGGFFKSEQMIEIEGENRCLRTPQQFEMNQQKVNISSANQGIPIPVDPTPSCVPKFAVPRPRHIPGINKGVGSLQFKGRHLTHDRKGKGKEKNPSYDGA